MPLKTEVDQIEKQSKENKEFFRKEANRFFPQKSQQSLRLHAKKGRKVNDCLTQNTPPIVPNWRTNFFGENEKKKYCRIKDVFEENFLANQASMGSQ